jgi:hypothetical protein
MSNFRDKSANAAEFRSALQLVAPGATARDVQKLFGPKADLRWIANWKAGDRWPPDWIVQVLQSELDKVIARALTTKARLRPGPGLKGNRANLKPFRQAV